MGFNLAFKGLKTKSKFNYFSFQLSPVFGKTVLYLKVSKLLLLVCMIRTVLS
jgi:hypothetical protein